MIIPRFQFAYALGYGVALASLANVESTLGTQNRLTASGAVAPIGILSPVLDPFPVRDKRLDGPERGDGLIDHEWELTLTAYALAWWVTNIYASETVVSAAMTINTPRATMNTYGRYSCDAILPSRVNGDIERIRGNLYRVRQRFADLVAL